MEMLRLIPEVVRYQLGKLNASGNSSKQPNMSHENETLPMMAVASRSPPNLESMVSFQGIPGFPRA